MIVLFLMMALIVILDQVSKALVAANLPYGQTVKFLDPVINLHYHENKGAAWGILADQPWVFMVLSSVAIVAIIVFLVLYRKKKLHPILRYGLAMVAAGGIGNMIDRVLNGKVVDFLEFGFFDFPIFNVADSFVTVGAFGIMGYLIFDSVRDLIRKKNKAGASEPVSADSAEKQSESSEKSDD